MEHVRLCLRCTAQACRLPASSRSADASWCLRGMSVRRLHAEAGHEFLGALQGSLAFFETGAVIPEVIGKGWIALDSLPTARTFLPLECSAELHHVSSSLWLSLTPRRGHGMQRPSGAVTGQRRTHAGWRGSGRRATLTSPSRPRGRLGPQPCRSDRSGWVLCGRRGQVASV